MKSALFALFALLVAASAEAQVSKSLHFDVDGVLPSSEPDITWRRWTPVSLESLFSVSGGYLSANTMPSTNYAVGYVYPELGNGGTPVNGGMTTGSPFIIEVRVRIKDFTPTSNPNTMLAAVTVWNGQRRFLMYFVPGGAVRFHHRSGYNEFPVDMTQFQTLRMESTGDHYDAYINGVKVVNQAFSEVEPGNGFVFLNHGAYMGADIDWDYVEFVAGDTPVSTTKTSWGRVKAVFGD